MIPAPDPRVKGHPGYRVRFVMSRPTEKDSASMYLLPRANDPFRRAFRKPGACCGANKPRGPVFFGVQFHLRQLDPIH
jgi:hypothetical protein